MEAWVAKSERMLVVRCDRRDLLLESLEEAARLNNILNGVIVSGIGTLEDCRLHRVTTLDVPAKEEFFTVEGPLEILSIDGILAEGKLHAHIAVADAHKAHGGHLEYGSKVLYLAEVAILEIAEPAFTRKRDSKTGLQLLRALK